MQIVFSFAIFAESTFFTFLNQYEPNVLSSLGQTSLQLLYMTYCKIASFNTSRLEAHAGFFRLLMKGIFDPCVL